MIEVMIDMGQKKKVCIDGVDLAFRKKKKNCLLIYLMWGRVGEERKLNLKTDKTEYSASFGFVMMMGMLGKGENYKRKWILLKERKICALIVLWTKRETFDKLLYFCLFHWFSFLEKDINCSCAKPFKEKKRNWCKIVRY